MNLHILSEYILYVVQIFSLLPTQIDVLINNGGRSQRSLFLDTSLDVYQALMELNFLGTVSLTKQVLSHMTQRGSGSIVTVSSVVGLAGAPLATGYSASKHALQVKHMNFVTAPPQVHQSPYSFFFFIYRAFLTPCGLS